MSKIVYDNHEEEWDRVLHDPERQKVGNSWLRDDTLDYWRHARMREPLNTIISNDPDAKWLTIGDGRFGTDASYIQKAGAKSVHCTDISDKLLKEAASKGIISEFSAQNAESLTFENESFDYVYCKESFHHFPRPYLALYEMFRVARKAIIITEPRDANVDVTLFSMLKRFIKKSILKRNSDSHMYEPVGNYLYSISEREIEKFLLGMNYPHVAYHGCNDAYVEGVEFVGQDSDSPEDIIIKDKLYASIKKLDNLTKWGISRSNIITAALFKEVPDKKLQEGMAVAGWKYKRLPSNPYK